MILEPRRLPVPERVWTDEEWDHLTASLGVEEAGEGWRVVVEPPWVRCAYGRFGLSLYEARFEKTVGGWKMVEAMVCGDRGVYPGAPPDCESRRLDALLRSRLPGQAHLARRLRAPAEAASRPSRRAFWIDDGWLLAGPAPQTHADYRTLSSLGISHVIDLRNPEDGAGSLLPALGMARSAWPLPREEAPDALLAVRELRLAVPDGTEPLPCALAQREMVRCWRRSARTSQTGPVWLDGPDYKPGRRFDVRLDTMTALRAIRGGVAASAAGYGGRQGSDGALMRILPLALTGHALPSASLLNRAAACTAWSSRSCSGARRTARPRSPQPLAGRVPRSA